MASNFTVEEALPSDMEACMRIKTSAFGYMPIEALFGNFDTPESRKVTGERHVQAWQEHRERGYATPIAIKCVHTDPATGEKTIVGFAEWYIFDRPRSREEYTYPGLLLTADWVTNDQDRDEARRIMRPMLDARVRWLGGRPCAILVYMCVDKAWRRQGASTLCVQWGIDKCRELGIPAYLEASEDGEPVYKRLGFEEVEKVSMQMGGEEVKLPLMIWWPPGTEEEDKVPVGP